MGEGVPEPTQESVMGVKAALILWDDAPNLRDNCHFPICWGHWRTICLLSWTICHVLIDFAHSWLCGAGLVGFRRGGRRRSGRSRKRSLLVRALIGRANRPVRRQQLLLRRRVERPRLVSVRQRVERWFWLDRPFQLKHLWRLRDPAPPAWRGRFPSAGAEPRLPTPGAVSAPGRGRRSHLA